MLPFPKVACDRREEGYGTGIRGLKDIGHCVCRRGREVKGEGHTAVSTARLDGINDTSSDGWECGKW